MKHFVQELVSAIKRDVSPNAARGLEELLQQPAVTQAIEAAEAETLAARAALVKRLRTEPADLERQAVSAAKAVAMAAAKAEAAREALEQAQANLRDASALHLGASFAVQRRSGELERELRETADPRLATTVAAMADVLNRLRNTLSTWSLPDPRTGRVQHHHNGAQLNAAIAAAAAVSGRMRAAQLEALSGQQVADLITMQLGLLNERLAETSLRPRMLDGGRVVEVPQ